MPSATGVTFTNVLAPSRYGTNQIYLNGAGVAAGDVDGDGWCDLYFCGLDRANVLYRNLGGWRFQDVTAASGTALAGKACTGAALADLDGDGDLDLIVNTVGEGTFVLQNDGRGRFVDALGGKPLNPGKGGASVALADIDGDGDLDVYIANYRTTTLRDMPNTQMRLINTNGAIAVLSVNGRPATEPDLVGRFTVLAEGRVIENGEPDVLYLNDGKGKFTPVPFTSGRFKDEDGKPVAAPLYDWGLTASFRDLNRDGAPDLYVCNDFESPDRIWINDGQGTFQALPRLALRKTSLFTMGVDFADINGDGHDDFILSDMLSRDHARRMLEIGEIQPRYLPIGAIDNRPQYSYNTLFLNRGDGTWSEIAQYAGVEASEWTWSPNFIDVDLDGYPDILITTGHELQMMHGDVIERAEMLKAKRQMSRAELQRLWSLFPKYALPNAAFRNRGDLTFQDVSEEWGFNTPDVGNSLALADLDNDGDLDAIVNNLNGVAELYRNNSPAPRIAVLLRAQGPNTQGIGARIVVQGEGLPLQSQEMVSGGRYLAANQAVRTFAAGSATNRLRVEVHWQSGRKSVVDPANPNAVYFIDERGATDRWSPPRKNHDPIFVDVSDRIAHAHHEEPFDEHQRQPLLPRALGQLGPGVSWLDVDSDGWDDLLIASGKGGRLALFHNRGDGTFAPSTNSAVLRTVPRDQTTVLGLGSGLLAGSSNYEDGLTNAGSVRVYDLARSATGDSILGQAFASGPLAMADIDGDGDLDLFIGGRVLPGRYPEPAPSLLLRKEGGRFVPEQRFDALGLVSGAVFSDLDGDGQVELVLACEWGPVRVLRRVDGQFQDQTAQLGLGKFTGWWAGVATGDLDGDGRLDIVASNWGLNSRYRPTPERPIWIHYGDFDSSGTVDVIESYINPATGQEVPRRGFKPVRQAVPFIQEKASTFEAYGLATLQGLFGDRLKEGHLVEANTLASMVFLNRGDHFEAKALPPEAQLSPAFGVCIADMDGDGFEDVFLSQNFFAVNPDDWRQDAGRGLWLRGDGRGGLAPVPAQESGIRVYGEQRGCAVADFDGDGRIDLAVGQNGAATKLYLNRKARPGLRIRLAGEAENPNAVGATVRVGNGTQLGPAREIQAGSGYWSHNSPVTVMSAPDQPASVWVRWPGGQTTSSSLPSGAKEIQIQPDGAVRVLR